MFSNSDRRRQQSTSPEARRCVALQRGVLLAAVLLAVCNARVWATTYEMPQDYAIVCLDGGSGAVLWKTRPQGLVMPQISSLGPLVWVEPFLPWGAAAFRPARLIWGLSGRELPIWLFVSVPPLALAVFAWLRRRRRLAIAAALLATAPMSMPLCGMAFRLGWLMIAHDEQPPSIVPGIGPLATLRRSLRTTSGPRLSYTPGDTRHLVDAGSGKILREIESYPNELTVVGNLAVFTYAGGSGGDVGGGEVYAFDLVKGELAWEFEAARTLPELSEGAYTTLAADGAVVYVAVDQVVFALDATTGTELWHTALPRQQIRVFDSPWTRFGSHNGRLVVSSYEQLCVLDPKTGATLWCVPTGMLSRPWPTASAERLLVAAREGEATMLSTSIAPRPPDRRHSVPRVERSAPNDYRVSFLSRREVPAGARLYSLLAMPPASADGTSRVVVRLEQFESTPFSFDLTEALSSNREVYLRAPRWTEAAILLEEGRPPLRVEKPRDQ